MCDEFSVNKGVGFERGVLQQGGFARAEPRLILASDTRISGLSENTYRVVIADKFSR